MDPLSLPFASLNLSSPLPSLDPPEFVTPDSKYDCTSCHRPLRDPLQTTCGHRICRSCFEELLQQSGPEGFMCLAAEEECERITQHKVNPDFSAVREMGLQSVYCLYRRYGCREQMLLKRLKDHVPVCLFVPVSCPFGCGELLPRGSVDDHLLNCHLRLEKCDQCGHLYPFHSLPEHIEKECLQTLVSCPFRCVARNLTRSQIESHRKTCPLRPKDCKYKILACPFQGTDAEVAQHEEDSYKEHLELATVHIMELQVENSRLNGSVQRVLSEMESLRPKVTELGREIEALQQSQQALSAQMKQSEQMQLKLLAGHSEKVLRLEDKVKTIEGKGQEIVDMQERLAQQEHRLQTISATGGRGVELPEAVREQFINHDRTIGVHDVRLAELSLRLQCMETTNYDGVLIWKICEYRRRRRDAVSGSTLSLYSQPFYTSRYGYKMCARVYLNGDGAGKGTHVSFFFVVMQGDYDDILRWPFQQKVTLMLVDQRTNRRHISDTFRPDPSSSSFMKPANPMNVASGCPLFVAHSQLENEDTFLVNDTLYFKVIVDTSDLLNP